jgi:adenylate kinase
MNLIFLGAPGVGKGTQAKMLSSQLHWPHISTGDILREAVRCETPLGQKAKRYMETGELVPDQLVIDIVKERLEARDTFKGFILDGFPRTVEQAEALEDFLSSKKRSLDAVLYFEASTEEIVTRLTGRRACCNCGAIYHLVYQPPLRQDRCGKCGGELFQRSDDREETVRNRLKVYEMQTAPLISFYEKKGLLRKVQAGGSVEEVHLLVKKVLGFT